MLYSTLVSLIRVWIIAYHKQGCTSLWSEKYKVKLNGKHGTVVINNFYSAGSNAWNVFNLQLSERPDRLYIIKLIKERQQLEKNLNEIKRLEDKKFNLKNKLTDQEESKILMKEDIMKQLRSLMPYKNL